MLSQVLAMALCRSSVKTDERIELGASFHPSYTVLKGNSVSPKIRVLPSGTSFQITDLEDFVSVYRLLKRVIDIARERWALRV